MKPLWSVSYSRHTWNHTHRPDQCYTQVTPEITHTDLISVILPPHLKSHTPTWSVLYSGHTWNHTHRPDQYYTQVTAEITHHTDILVVSVKLTSYLKSHTPTPVIYSRHTWNHIHRHSRCHNLSSHQKSHTPTRSMSHFVIPEITHTPTYMARVMFKHI